MILYIILLATLAWPASKCEPPVNSYLPPSGIGSPGASPSSQYGPPGTGGTGGNRRGNQPGAGQNRPQDSYSNGQTGPSIDTQYGPPSARGNGQGPQSFGSPVESGGFNQGRGSTPSSQYGAPRQNNGAGSRGDGQSAGGNRRLQSSYGPPSQGSGRGTEGNRNSFGQNDSGFGKRPQSSYGPPPTGGFEGKSDSQRLTSQGTQSSGSQNGFSSSSLERHTGGSPSSTYGVPDFEGQDRGQSNSFEGDSGSAFSGKYSGRGQNFNGGESNEPAKYEFSYDVDDSQTGGANGGFSSSFGSAGARGQGESQGYSRGGPGDNNNFSGSGQNPSSGRYQNANDFGQEDKESNGFNGYPSHRPGSRSGASSGSGQGQPGSQFFSSPDVEDLNGGRRNGYSSGNGPRSSNVNNSDGGSGSNGGNGEGYPRGRPGGQKNDQGGRGFQGNQNGDGGRKSSQSGGDEGYPNGGPLGQRGSGY